MSGSRKEHVKGGSARTHRLVRLEASNWKLQMLLWVFTLHHSLHHFPSALFIPKPDT